MPDGLYQAIYRDICAGFIVQNGAIVKAAPIVWKHRWLVKYSRRIAS